MKIGKFSSSAISVAIILIFSLCVYILFFAEIAAAASGNPVGAAAAIPSTAADSPDSSEDESLSVPVNLGSCTVELEYSSVSYDGSEKTPAVVSVFTPDGKKVPENYYSVIYSNNIEVGTATAALYGMADYGCYGSISVDFSIVGAVTGLKQTGRTKQSISLRWDDFRHFPVSGYAVYIYDGASSSWELAEYLDYGINGTTLDGLRSTKSYTVKVAVYTYDEQTDTREVTAYGEPVKMFTRAVSPPRITLKKAVAKKPYVALSWKKLTTCEPTEYQIMVSALPDFGKSRTITLKNGKAVSNKVFGLTNGKRYYFRIRAVKSFDGKILKGSWSNVKSAIATSTGWARSGKRLYYFVNGVSLKGTRTVGNEAYYFDKKTGECRGASYKVWQKIKNADSRTKYAVTVSIAKKRVNVFERYKGSWVMKYQWACTTGINNFNHPSGSFTPIGSFRVKKKLRWMNDEKEEYTVWYATGFYKRIYFHSVLYDFQDIETVQDWRLGIAASHGCIRLSLENAKWIYDNIGMGTRVIIF